MQTANIIPEWDTLAEALKVGLGYSDATLKRTRHTVIPHFIYIQIMLYSVELKAA